jgi:endonuclease/exonuclease/phosphatase family metal-dependent hydrolase
MERGPLRLFFSYAHEDEGAREQLDEHLELLRRQKVIVTWSDRLITPGRGWAELIEENMRAADIIVLLISPHFLASEFVWEMEIPLAMAEHERSSASVLPVLLEPVDDLATQPFGALEVLPTKGAAVSTWEDRERAFADIADGVRKAATEIIWDRGGPFEFGAHVFTDAELVELDDATRSWAGARLGELHEELTRSVPARRVEGNLLLATWSMRSLGHKAIALPECRYYLAAIISAFDVVTLQEVHDDLAELNHLLEILGPDWNYLVTDVSEGSLGNQERFAILHYAPRVEFEHVSGEVVLQRKELIDGEQFARKPLVASFRTGELRFRVCTAHLSYGGGGRAAVARTAKEAEALARHLVRRAERRDRTSIALCGNLNLRSADSDVAGALRGAGIELPESLLLPNLALSNSGYQAGAIGFVSPERDMRLGASDPNCGVFDFTRVLFRPEHLAHYRDAGLYDRKGAKRDDEREFRRWGVLGVSDHLPLWAELAA